MYVIDPANLSPRASAPVFSTAKRSQHFLWKNTEHVLQRGLRWFRYACLLGLLYHNSCDTATTYDKQFGCFFSPKRRGKREKKNHVFGKRLERQNHLRALIHSDTCGPASRTATVESAVVVQSLVSCLVMCCPSLLASRECSEPP